MILIKSTHWRRLLLVLPVALVFMTTACGEGDSEERVRELEEKIADLEEKVGQLEGAAIPATPTLTPTATLAATPTATATLATLTHEGTMETGTVQEIGLIENYRATRFFPRWLVVLKDIPVRIYLTRLHLEHVNRFTIEPFYASSRVILPGEIGVIEFMPDQAGEFKIRNVGHSFEVTLMVVETEDEAKALIADRGIQMYALIHSINESKIFPDRLVVQNDIPVTIHNISLIAEHRVSIDPFYVPGDINVRPKEISRFEFTPDRMGEFTIRHEVDGITGQLIVEE